MHQTPVKTGIYDKGDYDSMREMMRSRDWEMELSDKTVDEQWITTMGTINDATRKCIPKRRSHGKGIRKKMKPVWMNEKVTAAVKKKTEAYTKYRQSREGTDYINYRRSANRVKAEVRKAVRTFEKMIAMEAKKNPKAFFNYARSKMKTRTGICDLEYPDGRMAHTDVEKAELLNAFFSDVFTKEYLATIPTFDQRAYREPLTDITINDDMVAAVLGRLKPNKSPSSTGRTKERDGNTIQDDFHTFITIFTRSLPEGQLPPSWKEANVTPIYKKGKSHIPGNYRAVSLTSLAGKFMERLIRDAIMTHMTENDLLSPKQHGFIQWRSCVTQLLAVLDSWTLALDEGGNIDTIYIDLSKAFDTVPHKRLLMKLRGYGIEGRILTWIEAFLTDRRQRVVVNDSRSSWADVTSGIPQGSVLRPMLFICYINDMPSSVLSFIYLFADDAKLYRNISSDDDPPALQHDLQQLEKWSEKWQLCFNLNKCKVMHLGRQNPRQNYTMGGTTLATTTSEKDLGVYVDTELTFEKHIETVVNQANRMLGLIRRSYTYLDSQSLLKIYQSCQADARVCKCSMDSYPETWPNPTRECSAMSNEADTRATDTETTEPILPKSTWRHDRGLQIHTQHLQNWGVLSHYSARLTPRQEATLTSSRKNAVIRGLEPISSVTASPTDGTICVMTSSLPRA